MIHFFEKNLAVFSTKNAKKILPNKLEKIYYSKYSKALLAKGEYSI
jgi:hypothetical protein